MIEGDSDGLWRVLENLIENAALHGATGRTQSGVIEGRHHRATPRD